MRVDTKQLVKNKDSHEVDGQFKLFLFSNSQKWVVEDQNW